MLNLINRRLNKKNKKGATKHWRKNSFYIFIISNDGKKIEKMIVVSG